MCTSDDESNQENNKEDSICLFYSGIDTFNDLIYNQKMLKTLIVMGQRVDSLKGIELLHCLEELWVVDCHLQQDAVSVVNACYGLKWVYIYNNDLTSVPDLSKLVKLTTLWLSSNKIEDGLQNIASLAVKELNLSDNKIASINAKFFQAVNLDCLYLSGNPLRHMKEIQNLVYLKSLRELTLSDPLYKPSPITLLDNLRSFIVYNFPLLKCLDVTPITKVEQKKTKEFYVSKTQFYRLTLYNSLGNLSATMNNELDILNKELKEIWCALHSSEEQINSDTECSHLRFWEGEAERWTKKLRLHQKCHSRLEEIWKIKCELELQNCGNLYFEEVRLEENLYQFQKAMEVFVCSNLKSKMINISVLHVWLIKNSCCCNSNDQLVANVCILCPIYDLDVQPFKFIETLMFDKTNESKVELLMAKCFGAADPLLRDASVLHQQLLLRSQALPTHRLVTLCSTSDPALDLESPHSTSCLLFSATHSSTVTPQYIAHIKYNFQDYFKPLKKSVKNQIIYDPLPLLLQQSTSHITTLVLRASNISRIEVPIMSSVTVVDLSYNLIEDLSPISHVFPNLSSLNLSFNKIRSLESLQTILTLSSLKLKWNFINDFMSTVITLKGMTCLGELHLDRNPFQDILSKNKQLFLVKKYLNLQSYNGEPMTTFMSSGQVTISRQDQFPLISVRHTRTFPLTLSWRSEQLHTDGDNNLGVINNDVVSITLKQLKLTNIRSVFSLGKVRWLDLSDNLVSNTVFLKNLPALEEINLSHNMIETFSCPNAKFKYLTKLNLSNNHITSLSVFNGLVFSRLQLLNVSNNSIESLEGLSNIKSLEELYMSHNRVNDIETFIQCKLLKNLAVLNLAYNPVTQKECFRLSCLYHINSLKFINGIKVEENELKQAVAHYEGLVDQHYLGKLYPAHILSNLMHISLPKCAIKKILLPGVRMERVISVSMDHNRISSLSWLQAFPNVTSVNLSHNHVVGYFENDLSADSFNNSHLPHLTVTTLILDHNSIHSLPPLHLNLFPNLKLLDLNDNKITLLSGLTHNCELKQLFLDRNRVSYISVTHFQKLSNLAELYLEHNSITNVDFLPSMKRLKKLFLGFNKLTARSCLAPLGELPELQELTIGGNPLARHPSATLPRLRALQVLDGCRVYLTSNEDEDEAPPD